MFTDYKVQAGRSLDDPISKELIRQGQLEASIAEKEMPGIRALIDEYGPQKPLQGARLSGCLHMTTETCVLIRALKALGASVRWSSCNIFSTQDTAAYLMASEDTPVFAWKGMTEKDYWWCIEQALSFQGSFPHLIIDDGGDMTSFILDQKPEAITTLKGIAEETTTGVRLLRKRQPLPFPSMAVNDLITKCKFDNRYGCQQSLLAGLMQGTNIMIGGKIAVICGFGDVGKGCAKALSSLGARVIITEIDPINAYQALMEGFEVITMEEAAPIGDLFITATGCRGVIQGKHMEAMKDQALLANIGHFDIEIDVAYLQNNPQIERVNIKPLVDQYFFKGRKKSVILLAEGRLVNLSLAKGHPSFVMSNSFAGQILAVLELWTKNYPPGVHHLPRFLDEKIARMHINAMGAKLTELTPEQAEYLGVPQEGPYKSDTYKNIAL